MNVAEDLQEELRVDDLDIPPEDILDERAFLLCEWLIGRSKKGRASYPEEAQFMKELPSVLYLSLKFMLK